MLFFEKAKEEKENLLSKWKDLYYKAYELGSAGLVRASSDKFTNPIGIITSSSLKILFEAVVGDDVEPLDVQNALKELIQLRSIQKMSPTEAVGPLVQLKKLFKEEIVSFCLKENNESKNIKNVFDEYFIAEARIDSLFLMALDLYAHQKEKIFNLRVEEIHRNQSQVVRWAKLHEKKQNTNHKTEG